MSNMSIKTSKPQVKDIDDEATNELSIFIFNKHNNPLSNIDPDLNALVYWS